jgi:hypothetical protein
MPAAAAVKFRRHCDTYTSFDSNRARSRVWSSRTLRAAAALRDQDELPADVAACTDPVGLDGTVERVGLYLDHSLLWDYMGRISPPVPGSSIRV